MTYIRTARFIEVIGLQIGTIQEIAQKLHVNSSIQELDADITILEKAVSELKGSLAAIPHEHG